MRGSEHEDGVVLPGSSAFGAFPNLRPSDHSAHTLPEHLLERRPSAGCDEDVKPSLLILSGTAVK